ncbi:MAG: hypothetical protein ABI537_07000 [Casimicrobiaceae bacterium]
MAVTAKVLELGVPLVTSFHVARIVLLLLCSGPLFAWLQRRRRVPAVGLSTTAVRPTVMAAQWPDRCGVECARARVVHLPPVP